MPNPSINSDTSDKTAYANYVKHRLRMNALALCSILSSVFLMTLAPTTAAAEKLKGWQFIGRFESGDTQYIDMSALKKERGYVRVRTLVDYEKPVWSVTSENILSETGTDYIDCKKRRYLILETASFECRMAKCTPIESAAYPLDETEFKPISTMSSHVGNVFDLVCQ